MDTVLSVVVLAAIVLVAGAIWQWRRGGMRKQVWLMLLLAFIMIANVLIWIVPNSTGEAPVTRLEQGPKR